MGSEQMLNQPEEVNVVACAAIVRLDDFYRPAKRDYPHLRAELTAVFEQKRDAIYAAMTIAEVEAAEAIPWPELK